MLLAVTLGLLAAVVIACGAAGLSEDEIAEFERLEQAVVRTCSDAEPDEVAGDRLHDPLGRLVELARQGPEQTYDSDRTKSPSVEDDTFPSAELMYVAGLLQGREGPPPCNRREGARLERVIGEEFD
jgi:hypothetical protein